MNHSFLTNAAIGAALFATSLSAQAPTLRVALCGSASTANVACQWTSPRSALLATGLFAAVDIINCTTSGIGTPSLSQLLQYDALLVYTNVTPANNVALGDVLADYVDAGGGVVVAVFANSTTTSGRNLDGRWQSGYEVILDRSGNATGAGGTLGTVHVPGHPVMAGVTSFTGGSIGSRPIGTALEVGAFVIAEWSDGKILAAQGANPRRIDLGFYPPQSACSGSGWATGGDLLMANALAFVGTGGRFSTYGAGCVGSLGTPTLAAVPGTRPAFGQTLLLEIGNLPLGFGFAGLGFSNTQSGPFTLPFDLGLFGAPGCNLLADPAVSFFLLGLGSTVVFGLQVPANPALQDLIVFAQGFALDPAANGAGLTTSNGGRIRVGS